MLRDDSGLFRCRHPDCRCLCCKQSSLEGPWEIVIELWLNGHVKNSPGMRLWPASMGWQRPAAASTGSFDWTVVTNSFPVKCWEGSLPLSACMEDQSCPFVSIQTSFIFQTDRTRSECSTCCDCSKRCQSDSISSHFIDQQGSKCNIILTTGCRILTISAILEKFFVAVSCKPAVLLSALHGCLPQYTNFFIIDRKKSLCVVTRRWSDI